MLCYAISLDKFPQLNYHKTLNPHLFVPPLDFRKKILVRKFMFENSCPVRNPGSPLLQGGRGGGGNYGY